MTTLSLDATFKLQSWSYFASSVPHSRTIKRMNPDRLQTERLELVLPSVEETLANIEAMSADEKSQLSQEWLELVRKATAPSPWIHGFSMSRSSDNAVVGQCGFKGPPNTEGIVEIAYAVDPDHQNCGYATEAAAALVALAHAHADVITVRAHTLPESNASTRVLKKCGFQYLGEVTDPDDGLVWRWEHTASDGVDA